MEIKASTAFMVPVKLRNSTTGAGTTGKLYTDVTVKFQKQAGVIATKTMGAGDFTELDATAFAGVYDLLLSAAELDTTGFFKYSVAVSGSETYHGVVEIVANTAADVMARTDMPTSTAFDAVESQRGHHTTQRGGFIYVGPVNGNDTTGNGTRAAPYKTVTKALSTVTLPHTCIYVLADQGTGVTTLTETIAWNVRYCFLRGPGRDLLIRGASANTPTITVTVPGAEFSGFQLESHATGSNAVGIQATSADFTYVHHVFINATQGTGVDLVNCSNARVNDCTFQGTGVSAAGHGLSMACSGVGNSNHNRIEGNKFYDVLGDSIRLTKAGSGANLNNCVMGNSIHGSTGIGVSVGNGVVDTQIHGNHFGMGNVGGDIVDAGTGTAAMNNEQWTKAGVWTNAKAALLDVAVSSVGGATAAAVWSSVLDIGLTAEQAMRLISSVLGGKVSGAGTGTEVFRNVANTKNRVTSTVDVNGNRTSITIDLT